jgi:hypothetical protein
MAKRFIDSDLFKKRFVRGLKGAYKLLWVYFFCECDNAGILEVDIEAAELFCGHKYSLDEIKQAFNGRIHFFNNDAKAFLPDFIEFQYGTELNEKNPAHRSAIEKLNKYQLLDVLTKWSQEGTTKPLTTPLPATKKACEAKGTEGKNKLFVKPTLEEVMEYCKERGNGVDPQQWIDHYTSNGWKVGKNPMKDWKAAVRTWEKNGFNENGNGKTGTEKNRHKEVSGSSTKKTFRNTL